MKRLLISILIILSLATETYAQSSIMRDFKPVCDSLDLLIKKNRDVKGRLSLRNVMKRGNVLDFYFTESLGDFPWREEEPEWFRKELIRLMPEKYRSYEIGYIYSKRIRLERLPTAELGFNGKPTSAEYRTDNPSNDYPLVRKVGGPEFSKGLDGRNIAVWQSHGRYFDYGMERWIWQRPPLFQTVEDMFTQSFVLPYLVPMLENAGAYVMLPRERDIQTNELIVDYDSVNQAYGQSTYKETGRWKDAGSGFAAKKAVYMKEENPFKTGTSRLAEYEEEGSKNEATAVWRPEIPERGQYAVYISYKSLPESAKAVAYSVRHMGGTSEFIVNQSIGGGTWIYLGSFEFDKGSEGYVSVSNTVPKGYSFEKGKIVTADAVRFGGGMGNIARSRIGSEDEAEVSAMPRSAEGARYYLQWAGIDSEIYSQNDLRQDYRDDFMSRGDWVEWISRGSDMNPSEKPGLGIPVDLALGFHSDAGITPNDSIVGTLAIYTLNSEGKETLAAGESRMTSREYADLVQSQIVNDLKAEFDPLWSRRCIWDRGYRESRTPSCPSMLLELLSHQNFADMKYGLDPSFRFAVGRAVYKGMLKYLSNRYGVPYTVQPLPVRGMGVEFISENKGRITWQETPDELEPTAVASEFILYTRIDDGAFDKGQIIKVGKNSEGKYSYEIKLEKGKIYSFKIVALNEGGLSFPSEIVSIGIPEDSEFSRKVLIINNFDRVSGPAFIDTPSYAGFDNRLDSGVPDRMDIAYIGDMYEYRRDSEFITNDNPGFGASYDDYAGRTVAGNSFDYAYVHGKAMMKTGYAFYSCSNEAFEDGFGGGAWALDLICGKQVTTVVGTDMKGKYQIFPLKMQEALKEFTSAGGHILVSGANIATDVWDGIYPAKIDEEYRKKTKEFVRTVLGYKWIRNNAGRSGEVNIVESTRFGSSDSEVWEFFNEINSESYCVESPDGISPVSAKTGSTTLRYSDTKLSAGVCYEGDGYKTVSLGFPIECLKSEKNINEIISLTLQFFSK